MTGRLRHLLAPGAIGPMALRNRILVTAMGTSFSEEDGTVGERLIAYHEEQARGGAGLIITGVTSVGWPNGANIRNQTAISDDRFLPGLRQLTDRVHRHGAKIAAQLHHGGLNAAFSAMQFGEPLWGPVAPPKLRGDISGYYLPEEMSFRSAMAAPVITPLDQDGIASAIAMFAAAARRAQDAGFDGVEIHGGHGYLLSSFLSPATNARTDAYGGSLENRARFAIEVIRAVRTAVGGKLAVWIKIDSREVGRAGGITLDLATQFAKLAEAAGADAINVSAYHETGDGRLHSDSHTPHVPAHNLEAAAAIRKAVSVPVIGSGRVEPEVADRAIAAAELDFVAMGRKLLADPHLPAKLVAGASATIRPCIYCYTCISAIYTGGSTRCAVNPLTGDEMRGEPDADAGGGLNVAVVGGGPAGMEAARRLAASGARVTLFELSDTLGGTLRVAGLAYEPNARLLEWLRREVGRVDVTVRLGTAATPEILQKLNIDTVVVATGAVRELPELPGSQRTHVFSGDEMHRMMRGDCSGSLRHKTNWWTRSALRVGAWTGASANLALVRSLTHRWMPLGKRIVIVGGELVGLELAEFLAERGRTVSIVEDGPRFGRGLPIVRRMRLLRDLSDLGVGLYASVRDVAIEPLEVRFVDEAGVQHGLPADHVIMANGARSDMTLANLLADKGFDVHAIGDMQGVGYIESAMRGAAEAVRAILAANRKASASGTSATAHLSPASDLLHHG